MKKTPRGACSTMAKTMHVLYILVTCAMLGAMLLVLVEVRESTRLITRIVPSRLKDRKMTPITPGIQAPRVKSLQGTRQETIRTPREIHQLQKHEIKNKPTAPKCKYCINPEDYEVLISPFDFKVEKRKVDVVIVIPSRNNPNGFERRMAIRNTWGKDDFYLPTKVSHVFVLGE